MPPVVQPCELCGHSLMLHQSGCRVARCGCQVMGPGKIGAAPEVSAAVRVRRLCDASGVVPVGTMGDEREWFCPLPAAAALVDVDGVLRTSEVFCVPHAQQHFDGNERMWPVTLQQAEEWGENDE